MLDAGDRFVMEGLECAFRNPPTANAPLGTVIHMGALVRKVAPKGTVLPRELVLPFAKALEPCYACTVAAEMRPTGFIFTFTGAPARGMHHEAETIRVTRREVSLVLLEPDPLAGAPPSLVGMFSPAALDVFRWFLHALSGKPHTTAVTPDEIRWDPPMKPPGYTPLPRNQSKDEEGPPSTVRSPPSNVKKRK